MVKKRTQLLAGATIALLVAAGCSSTKSNAGSGSSGSKTYTIGVLTDLTGIAASASKTTPEGVKAGTVLAARDGFNIKYDVVDTTSSLQGTLAAAHKLVQQNHVLAVIALSAFTFAASDYLAQQHVPVVGLAEDSTEWTTVPTMFSSYGATHPNAVSTTVGKFMKMEGVTSLGAIGYGISPSSSQAAAAGAKSAQDEGIKVGYLNAKFPFGSTNVGPEVIAMKNGGVDGLLPTTDPNTAFSLITGLRQAGVTLKASLLPTGYGGDLLQAGPGALQSAQGVYFESEFEPVEMNDAATQQFQSDLKVAGITNIPTYAEYGGYTSMGLLVRGLKAAGTNVTQSSLTAALSQIHDWDALGLWGGRTLDINDRANGSGSAANCTWVVKLSRTTFDLVPGADPLCGTSTGQTVSS